MSRAMSRAPSWIERRILRAGAFGTAARLQGAGVAVELAGAVAHHAVLIGQRSRVPIGLLPLPQLLAGRADVGVAAVVVGEVGPLKVPSWRSDLSKTGMCGSIPRSWTSQARFSAEP